MKSTIAAALTLLFPAIFCTPNFAQKPIEKTLFGLVTNETNEPLIGATIFWKDSKIGTITDTTGQFRIIRPFEQGILVVRYVGYTPVEIEILPGEEKVWIEVKGVTELQQVTVSGHGFDNSVSLLESRAIERINSRELRKAPCCNLSESFETTGAVDVTYANAITGVKEIQMLGLRGIYSQFLVENRPTMGGIATPMAFELIPGTWLDGIVLAKGASTVKNGFAGISGQINVDLVKPHLDKPLFINAFGSSEGRGELNLHVNKKGKKYYSNGLLLHGSFVENQWDMNRDNFFDSPNRKQLNAMYRMTYESPIGCGQFNVQALTDQRAGGQIRETQASPDNRFTFEQSNDRLEAWGKFGKEGIFGKPYNEIGNIAGASWHRVNAVFGKNTYLATQKSAYFQTLFQTIFGTTDHKFIVAPNLQFDDYQELVNEGKRDRQELVPGIMGEYTFSRPNLNWEFPDLVIVAGARLDWHNLFGWLFTPRLSAKFNYAKEGVVRISAGRGFRSPNLVPENISWMATNKKPIFPAEQIAEEAWNYGLNITQEFKIANRSASISLDLFRTDFVKQVLVDVEADTNHFIFFNLNGKSFANSALTVFQWNVLPGFDLKIAAKTNDVKATFTDGKLKKVPLVAKFRGLVSLDYTTPGKKWVLNTSTQIIGTQRIPDNSLVPHRFLHDFVLNESPTYALWRFQATRKWKNLEIYFGGENLTNYQQHHAIIAANEPTSIHFNAGQLWAPMMGTVGYAGLRFSPSGLEKN